MKSTQYSFASPRLDFRREELEAVEIRPRRWAVRPRGCLGTCGSHDGKLWTVQYINASSEREAIAKALVR